MLFDMVLLVKINGGTRTTLVINIRDQQIIHTNNNLALVNQMIRRNTKDLNGLTNQGSSRRENGLTNLIKILKGREKHKHMKLLALPMKL